MRASGTAHGPVSATNCSRRLQHRERGDYFYANYLWWLRVRSTGWSAARASAVAGAPDRVAPGDVVDSWRVIALEPGRRLTLLMEMKARARACRNWS